MSDERRLGTSHLIARHLRSGATASVLVAVLVGVAVLVVSLAPRALTVLATDELHHTVAELSPVRRDLSGSSPFGFPLPGGAAPTTAAQTFDGTASALEGLSEGLDEPLATLLGAPEWVVRGAGRQADPVGVADPDAHPVLALAYDLVWQDRVELVEGEAPAPWTGTEPPEAGFGELPVEIPDNPPIEVVLSQEAADLAGLEVGDVLDYKPAPLLISGLYEPLDLDAEYWDHAPDLATGASFISSESGQLVYASAYLNPESAVPMRQTLGTSILSVWYPIDTSRLGYDEAPGVGRELVELEATGRNLPGGESVKFASGLPEAIEQVVQRVTLVTALITLTVTGPIGVVLAVFALGVQSVIERRRAALALASARGATGLQLRLLMLLEGLLISVPAAIAGAAIAAALIPAPLGPVAVALPLLLAAAPPLFFAGFTSIRSIRAGRSDLQVRARGGARWIVEVAVVGIAALSLYLLFRRGLAESTLAVGVDPLLVLTPLLLSLAVCVLVLRIYPALMLAVQRVVRRRRGAVALLGSARAVRSPALGFVAALALVVGISIAVFSTSLSTTVATALEQDARLSVGADARVRAANLDGEVVDAVAGVAGVTRVVPVQRTARIDLSAGLSATTVTVVIVDSAELNAVRPDLPALPEQADGIPLLVSADLSNFRASDDLELEGRPATIVAVAPEGPLAGIDRSWVVMDAADAVGTVVPEFDPSELLVDLDPDADADAVTAQVRDTVAEYQTRAGAERVEVVAASGLVADALDEPVIGGLRAALLLSTLTATLLSALAVVLASIAAGPARNRLIGVLRLLGMSPRQVGALIGWELGPIAITAIVTGAALGLAELWIVMAALDLRPFLSGAVAPVAAVDAGVVAIVVAGFAIAVLAAGALAVAIGRRFSPASSVKIGTE